MNHWQDEVMAEYLRQRILEEVEQIRLEKLARQARPHGPRLFEEMMFHVVNWMISTGKQLRKHYEIPKEERWIDPHTKVAS